MFFRVVGDFAHKYRWLVLGVWLALAVVLNVVIPQLDEVIRRDSTPFLPADSRVMSAYHTMGAKFGGSGRGIAILVMEDRGGLTDADRAFYADVVSRVRADHDRVDFVQDYIAHPELKDTLTSHDGKALYTLVALRHVVGTPEGDKDAPWLRNLMERRRPAGLGTYVTGDSAIIGDFQDAIQGSVSRTTIITLGLLIVILLTVYRSPVTPLVPLTTIGIAIMVVRPLVALMGLHFIKVASFTETFILALVFGAGTDYCIFLISRFREQVAAGDNPATAMRLTSHRVGEAITSSAATVIMGGIAMSTASVALFSTTGPAIAAAVAVTLVAGLTLTPALVAIGGERAFWPGGFKAKPASRFWTRAAELVTTRPRRVFAFALIPLVLLAALYPTLKLTYDERGPQPESAGAIQGLHALDRHFPAGEVLPDYVIVSSDHDLRNPADLAALDAATRAAAAVPGVASVRSFTQPQGTRLAQASIPYQAGQVAHGLGQAHDQLVQGSNGIGQLTGGAAQVAGGAGQAQAAVDQFVAGLTREDSGLGTAVAGSAGAGGAATQLRDGARQLSAGLRQLSAGLRQSTDGLSLAIDAMTGDPVRATDPVYQKAYDGVVMVRDAQRNQILPGLDQAVSGADRVAAGNGDLATGMGQLHDGLVQAQAGIQQLEAGERVFKAKLGQLAGGAARVSGGVAQLAGGTDQLKAGLGQAADYLGTLSREAQVAGLDSFYVPTSRISDPQLALARYYYLSTDGTAARILVLGQDDPFKNSAMDRVGRERDAITGALRGTHLAGARVEVAGDAALNENLRDLFQKDFRLVAFVVLAGVLGVLILLLRSLVAPIYLLASVLLSYAAAMGFTAFFWQVLLHKQAIDWTVPIFTFVMLVAVGADYNIFLMSRVREEVQRDPAGGIGRAVRRTGSVITSAGVIFAGTFAAMVTSPLVNIAETGFAITFGLLLDTLVVRSFLVPAVAVMLGKWNWWPHLGFTARKAAPAPAPASGSVPAVAR